jgi:hypothetical protein
VHRRRARPGSGVDGDGVLARLVGGEARREAHEQGAVGAWSTRRDAVRAAPHAAGEPATGEPGAPVDDGEGEANGVAEKPLGPIEVLLAIAGQMDAGVVRVEHGRLVRRQRDRMRDR